MRELNKCSSMAPLVLSLQRPVFLIVTYHKPCYTCDNQCYSDSIYSFIVIKLYTELRTLFFLRNFALISLFFQVYHFQEPSTSEKFLYMTAKRAVRSRRVDVMK